MGTIFAPTYATLTMGYLEVHFYNTCELKWGKEFQELILENWSCFLDGCPLDKNKVKPDELLETLKSVNEAIQFTMEFSDKEIPFLDILIKRGNSGIWMDMYHKTTDTQRYLPYSTSHPKYCLKSIPFVMARRICTIAENNSLKNMHLRELKKNFRLYSYLKKLLKLEYKKH